MMSPMLNEIRIKRIRKKKAYVFHPIARLSVRKDKKSLYFLSKKKMSEEDNQYKNICLKSDLKYLGNTVIGPVFSHDSS